MSRWTPLQLPNGDQVIRHGDDVLAYLITRGDRIDKQLTAGIVAELLNDHLDEPDVDRTVIDAVFDWISDRRNYFLIEQNGHAGLANLFMAYSEDQEEALEAERISAYIQRGEGEGCWYCGRDHATAECSQARKRKGATCSAH